MKKGKEYLRLMGLQGLKIYCANDSYEKHIDPQTCVHIPRILPTHSAQDMNEI